MEVSLQAHKPLSCRTVFQDRTSFLKLKPVSGFRPNGRYSSWFKGDLTSGVSVKITANTEFSRWDKQNPEQTNQGNTWDKKELASSYSFTAKKELASSKPLTVTIFYSPANTALHGKPEVWFRCSFNHWAHRAGPLPPQKMVPADNGTHVKATVMVPRDAYVMDFVFSETEEGGVFDKDYHIPVVGRILQGQGSPMHIVHITVEMAHITLKMAPTVKFL